jgi:hypothetical protein
LRRSCYNKDLPRQSEEAQKASEIGETQSNASLSWRQIGPRDVEENSAACAWLSGIVVVSEDNDDIIERIISP